MIHDSVQKTLAPVWHKLISKKKNVKQDHKGTDKILDILALSPLWGNGLSQTWASIYLHVYCPYLHNVFMKGGGGGLGWFILEVLQKRQFPNLSSLKVGLSISGYSMLLLFYVSFSILNHHLAVSVLLPSASFVSH